VEFCLLHHGVLRGKFRWNLQLRLPPRVEFTPCFLAGNTTKCSSKPVVFPYFYHKEIPPQWNFGDNMMIRWHSWLKTANTTSYLCRVSMPPIPYHFRVRQDAASCLPFVFPYIGISMALKIWRNVTIGGEIGLGSFCAQHERVAHATLLLS
jgi:hypothetical protein